MLIDKPQVIYLTADNFDTLAGVDLSFSMVLVRQGMLTYRTCGSTHQASAQSLVFAPSQSSFAILNISADADLLIAVWSLPFAICAYTGETMLDNIFFVKRMVEPKITLNAQYTEMVSNYMCNFGNSIDDTNHLFYNQMVFTTFSGLIFLSVYLFSNYDKAHLDAVLRRDSSFCTAEQLTDIFNHEDMPNGNVAHYAELLGVSNQYLHRVVRKVFGAPFEYIYDYYRLFYIHRQLLYTNKDLDEIAEEASFSSTNALIRFFKQTIKITPAKYRSLKSYSMEYTPTPLH
ncbi:MAG: helix-turn-helix domain-containing protein [Muribaculaceae bacterium]